MIAYIALGGIAGTLARYLLQGWVQARAGVVVFPLGTSRSTSRARSRSAS